MRHLQLYEEFIFETDETESGPKPDSHSKFRGMITDPKAAKEYMFAGKSIFTISNPTTHTRFTYKVTEFDTGSRILNFVSVMNGPDNERNYSFIGTIFDGKEFRLSAKSRIGADAPSVKGFEWLFRTLTARPDRFNLVEFWHEEYCGKCGRKLTVPSSIASGYGPECSKMMAKRRNVTESESHELEKALTELTKHMSPIIDAYKHDRRADKEVEDMEGQKVMKKFQEEFYTAYPSEEGNISDPYVLMRFHLLDAYSGILWHVKHPEEHRSAEDNIRHGDPVDNYNKVIKQIEKLIF